MHPENFTMTIDERLANTKFSLPAIREVNQAKHPSSISLGLGELKNFPVDPLVIERLQNFDIQEAVSYTQNAGLPALRKAVANAQHLQDGFAYTEDHVVCTIGVQNAMYSAIKTLASLGAKRVLIPEIHFGIYKKIPEQFNLEVVCYPLTDDFGIDVPQLSKMLLADDILVINSPSNPTGRVFSNIEQTQLGELVQEKLAKGYVISDEIYNKLIYEGEAPASFSKYFSRTLVLNGISKSGAVAGLRVGWIVCQEQALVKAIVSTNATIISCPPTLNQLAAIPVVEGLTQGSINAYNSTLLNNRNMACEVLDELDISYVRPSGSFYIFPQLKGKLEENIKAFCLQTAQQENGVVVIPGIAFNAPDYIRISLASSQIQEGMERLGKALKK